MKTKCLYQVLMLCVALGLQGQVKQFNLRNAGMSQFKGNVFVYGFAVKEKRPVFCVYKLDQQLAVTDSLMVGTGKASPDTYLDVSADTLHDFLNIYLQKKEKKLVNIIRLNKDLELIAQVENVDVARLNSISDFENELYYFKNAVFTIKHQKDSTGQQFYLNKYTVKSETKNFEYNFVWQFPFERKNIHSAHIFYADRKVVLLYVNLSGEKPGQWVLRINADNGSLVRGTKLNEKGARDFYSYGSFINDTLGKSLTLMGQKFAASQFAQAENKISISNAPFATVYLVEIDSLQAITDKQEFRIPVLEQKTSSPIGQKKTNNSYLLRFNKVSKNRINDLDFECDIFKNTDNGLCFWYSNTTAYKLSQPEGVLALEKNILSANAQIEKFFVTGDKLDVNGKIAVEQLSEFEKLYYEKITFPVRKQFKTDANKNPLWLLAKSNTKKNTVNFSMLTTQKDVFQISTVEDLPYSQRPIFIAVRKDLFVIGRQSAEDLYELKAQSW